MKTVGNKVAIALEDIYESAIVDPVDAAEQDAILKQQESEADEVSEQLSGYTDLVSEAKVSAITIEGMADVLQEAVDGDEEEVPTDALRVTQISLENIARRLKIKVPTEKLATEGFGKTTSKESVNMALEDIQGFLRNLWKAIKNTLMKIWGLLKDYLKKSFGVIALYDKKQKNQATALAHLSGTAEGTFENIEIFQALEMDGSVSKDSAMLLLSRQTDLTQFMLDYMDSTIDTVKFAKQAGDVLAEGFSEGNMVMHGADAISSPSSKTAQQFMDKELKEPKSKAPIAIDRDPNYTVGDVRESSALVYGQKIYVVSSSRNDTQIPVYKYQIFVNEDTDSDRQNPSDTRIPILSVSEMKTMNSGVAKLIDSVKSMGKHSSAIDKVQSAYDQVFDKLLAAFRTKETAGEKIPDDQMDLITLLREDVVNFTTFTNELLRVMTKTSLVTVAATLSYVDACLIEYAAANNKE